ncbi:N-acetylmuramoyl-L-alanine amidase [Povalibacter sp.]|uniref:N-acetylmuramoyl-L-alanine amidase n=1 Tax=Povalibacter sp. TaxID=1962978 RepID=UPI002D1FA92B|nr:N-acetylmuramoyl-L-alanine amidase [Povalibacter sp.]
MRMAPCEMTLRAVFRTACGVLCALFFASFAVAASDVTVKDIRLWAGPDSTRVVFDLSGPARYSFLTLQNPERVVVDIQSARLENANLAMPEGMGFAKQLRAGVQGADLRLVVDLTGPAAPKVFTVDPQGGLGHRLVLDLMPGSGAAANAAVPVVAKSAPLAPVVTTPTVIKSASTSGRDIVVAIDAGHGGKDPGSLGGSGTREKDITLAIARRLKERIDREPGMRAILTRDGDYYLAHRLRIKRARDQQADMFVSIHADSYTDRSVVGSSVYTLSARGASDEAARWLAERENASDLIGGVTLEDKSDVLASVLLDLSQGASMSASLVAADNVMNELDRMGNVTRRGVKQAGFLVLKSPDIPSMLVETAFISNPREESRLKDARHQQRLAEAIHAGVRAYFYDNPPPGTHFAQQREQRDGNRIAAVDEGGGAAGVGRAR